MKKSLLALAVLGAFAGTAAAQTNVTLYGIADAAIGAADRGGQNESNIVHVFSGVQSTSRFGVRGSEDLGNGLRGVFNLEARVGMDDGGHDAQFWQRRAVVGLAGGFGTIVLGRDYTPGFTAAGTTDVMGYGLFNNWLTYTTNGGIATRASNGLFYTSPNWGGLTVRGMFAAGETDDEYNAAGVRTQKKGTGNAYGLSAVYANGPFTLQGYYQQADGGINSDLKQYGIGGQYAFGMFRVALNYGMAEDTRFADEHEGLGVGIGVKVGQGEFLANYIRQEFKSDEKADSFGIAYVHPLSKRTNLYATYGQLKNKNGGQFGMRAADLFVGGDAPYSAGVNSKPKALAIGIRHMF